MQPKIFKIILLIILIFNCCPFNIYCQELDLKPKIYIDKLQAKGIDKYFNKEINKIIMRTILLSHKYDLVLNKSSLYLNNENSRDMFFRLKVKVGIDKKTGLYKVEILNFNSKNKIIQKLKKEKIEKRKLLFEIQKLFTLFVSGHGYAQREVRVKEIKNYLSSDHFVVKKKELAVVGLSQNHDASNMLEALDTSLPALFNKKESEKKKKTISQKKKKELTHNYGSPDILSSLQEKDPVKKKINHKIFSWSYHLEAYYEKSGSDIITFVDNQQFEVINNINRIYPGVRSELKLRNDYDKKLVFHLALGIPIIKQNNQINLSKFIAVNYIDKVFSLPILYNFGLDYDLDNFNTVGTRGTGVISWPLNILWIKFGLYYKFDFLNFEIGPYYAKSFFGSSTYTGMNLIISSIKSGFFARAKVTKNYYTFVKWEKSTIKSSTLSTFSISKNILKVGVEYFF